MSKGQYCGILDKFVSWVRDEVKEMASTTPISSERLELTDHVLPEICSLVLSSVLSVDICYAALKGCTPWHALCDISVDTSSQGLSCQTCRIAFHQSLVHL
jgi:hypothetical protein